jgi:hypothetical protein
MVNAGFVMAETRYNKTGSVEVCIDCFNKPIKSD